ncbi:MAG TPA: quinone oxidoreductase [Acidimicrobiia bacterium]|nr:quinone oxidoreductase [Acidimicrobiia bacterium]
MNAITVYEHGGPEVLKWGTAPDPEPGPGEILVKVTAAGVNFIDVYQRTGLNPVGLPSIPGIEGAGDVVRTGSGVEDFSAGDRAAWCSVRGSYAEYAAVPAARAVSVPEGLSTDLAAAALLQGATAHYLVNDTFPLQPGHVCLVHAAAGGAGRLLVQMAKRAGATVIATAGGPEKVELARTAGADHVIDYRAEDFAVAVEALVGKNRLDVVYDGVGKATFEKSMTLLRPRGMMVTYGNASGPPDPIAPLRLNQLGSIFLTRPGLVHHIASTEELRQRAEAVYSLITDGDLDVLIGLRLPLAEAAEAHRRLEARQTTGKVLLEP